MPQKSTSDKKLATTRRWQARNTQKVRETKRRWQLNNCEKGRDSARRWRENNPEKARSVARKCALRRRYGIDPKDFEALNLTQNGRCRICQKHCQKYKALSVDHCHKTGLVRGLLCDNCNKGLGFFKDDFSTLIRAANYIGWRSN